MLRENESYSGHGDDKIINFSWKLWRRNFLSVKLKNFKVLNWAWVEVTADTHRSQGQTQRRRQEHPKAPKLWFSKKMATLKCVLFVLLLFYKRYSLHDSLTSHLWPPLFLARCILFTGLSLVSACTLPLIRALRVYSANWQHQWRDTGGTVRHIDGESAISHKNLPDCHRILKWHVTPTPTLNPHVPLW